MSSCSSSSAKCNTSCWRLSAKESTTTSSSSHQTPDHPPTYTPRIVAHILEILVAKSVWQKFWVSAWLPHIHAVSTPHLYEQGHHTFLPFLTQHTGRLRQVSATIMLRTPNTTVIKLPQKISIVAGLYSMTGTANWPQLSPAITVLNNSRLALITEDVADKHSLQSWDFNGHFK